jgi:toxin ParE1/3/4
MANRPRKSPQAEVDLNSIWDYIAADNVKAADALLVRIEELFDMLAQTPLAGRARNELAMKLRSFPVGNYVIFYIPIPDGIEVCPCDARPAGHRCGRHGVTLRPSRCGAARPPRDRRGGSFRRGR